MWSPWLLRSPSRKTQTQSHEPKPKPKTQTFSCSSFKDIQSLIQEEEKPEPESESEFCQLTPRRASIFHRVRISNSVLRRWAHQKNPTHHQQQQEQVFLPEGENRVVIFYTSLRVVRKTFEDCRAVRSILRPFRVRIDERDVSMDPRSLEQLQRIITPSSSITLPTVFVGGRLVGGADEIRRLQDSGELAGLIQRLPGVVDHQRKACEACGGMRFVVCDECDGSHKVYIEKCGFRICVGCNDNGLIRCPSCSSTVRFKPK